MSTTGVERIPLSPFTLRAENPGVPSSRWAPSRQSGGVGPGASASKAYSEFSIVATRRSARGPASVATPSTTSGCAYTSPSTGSAYPSDRRPTLAGVRSTSARCSPVRSLSLCCVTTAPTRELVIETPVSRMAPPMPPPMPSPSPSPASGSGASASSVASTAPPASRAASPVVASPFRAIDCPVSSPLHAAARESTATAASASIRKRGGRPRPRAALAELRQTAAIDDGT